MGRNPVNPLNATSAMGRGANHAEIGESAYRLEDQMDIGHPKIKTPDGPKDTGNRGTKRVPIYDAQGNLTGIHRVRIGCDDEQEKTSDGLVDRKSHRGNRDKRNRESDRHRIGKTSDHQQVNGDRGNRQW